MIGLYPGEASREQGAAEECLTNEPNNSLPNDSLEMMLPEMPASSQVFINENHLRRQ